MGQTAHVFHALFTAYSRHLYPVSEHVVITGGTGGLGTHIAQVFEKCERTQVTSLGSADLHHGDTEGIEAFFEENPADLLICCAGIIRDKPLAQMAEGQWDEVIAVNFTFARTCATRAFRYMKKAQKGHIVFITSYAANRPAIGQAAYAAAKASLVGLTTDLALSGGPHGIRVNAVAPGFLETNMTAAVSDHRKKIIRDLHLLNHFNTPEIAANFIHHLHYEMPYTTGQVFSLDSRLNQGR